MLKNAMFFLQNFHLIVVHIVCNDLSKITIHSSSFSTVANQFRDRPKLSIPEPETASNKDVFKGQPRSQSGAMNSAGASTSGSQKAKRKKKKKKNVKNT